MLSLAHMPPRLLLGLLLLGAAVARAQPPDRPESAEDLTRARDAFIAAHGDLPVSAIRVDGLDRTRPAVVQQWIRFQPGDPLSRCDLGELYERLYGLAIFSAVDVALDPEGDGVAVTIRLAEKWTLYPVPILWLFQGTEVAGLVLAESNAFGLNKGWALGGIYSNRGWYTIAAYVDPNIAFTSNWAKLDAFVGAGLLEDQTPAGATLQAFDIWRADVEYSLGRTLWDRLSPTLTGAFRWAQVGAVHTAGTVPAVDATVVVQGVQLVYNDRRYRFYYDEGLRLSLEVQHGFPVDGRNPPFNTGILDARLTLASAGRSSFEVYVRAMTADLPVVFEERLGGIDGSRTLPGGGLIAADRYASATLGYQVPLLTTSPGTLAAVVFAEAGAYERNEEPATSYGGPGGGLRFYLRQIAVPAVGVDVGYELRSRRTSFSVVVGYRPTR